MLNAYVYYDGTCEAAFKHYEKVLGAKIETLVRNEQAPPEMRAPPERRQKIMHGRISIGGQVVMASDAPPDHFRKPQGFSIALTISDPKEAETKFKALCEGGSINMLWSETFYAKGFGMGIDPFGIPWIVISPHEQ